MAAVNASLMAVNGVSLLQQQQQQQRPASLMAVNGVSLLQQQQRRQAERSTTSRGLRVKCMAKPPEESTESISTPPKKASITVEDVFAFGGPAPETINGRLAMLGFVSALGVEITSGRDLFSQLASGEGVPLFVGSALLFSFASLIPMFKGISVESKSKAVMSSGAEMLNGRFAMIGLIALALTEAVKGGPLIS